MKTEHNLPPNHSRIQQKNNKNSLPLIITSILLTIVSFSGYAQDGESLFKQNCAACHKVGGGRLVGPDLMGITSKRTEEWLMKWTKSSAGLIASGDADAKAIYEEFSKVPMPDQNIPDADIKAIYAFIASKSGPVAGTDTSKAVVVADASLTASAAQILLGKKLFEGSVYFTNGGPSCITCHNVNYKEIIPGGLLAKDLTNAWSRLGGDQAMHSYLGAPPFPAMTQSYKDRPITELEINALSAFLYTVDKDVINQEPKSSGILLFGGLAGMGGLLVIIFGLWFIRKKDNVKKSIYNRQIKSI